MYIKTLSSISLGIIAVSCLYAGSAQAISLTAELEEFTGDNAAGKITLQDLVGGGVQFTAEITSPTVNGDIAGLWFGLQDTSLLSSLAVSGLTVDILKNGTLLESQLFGSEIFTSASSCPKDGGNNLNGGGSPCSSGLLNGLVSLGVGSSEGLVKTVSFTLSSSFASITVTDFNTAFGLRYQSTGASQGGSSKLTSKRCYYPGYMGTTSQTFDCSNGVPVNAVPVGGFDDPEDDPLNVEESSNKNKNQNQKKKKNKNKNK